MMKLTPSHVWVKTATDYDDFKNIAIHIGIKDASFMTSFAPSDDFIASNGPALSWLENIPGDADPTYDEEELFNFEFAPKHPKLEPGA